MANQENGMTEWFAEDIYAVYTEAYDGYEAVTHKIYLPPEPEFKAFFEIDLDDDAEIIGLTSHGKVALQSLYGEARRIAVAAASKSHETAIALAKLRLDRELIIGRDLYFQFRDTWHEEALLEDQLKNPNLRSGF